MVDGSRMPKAIVFGLLFEPRSVCSSHPDIDMIPGQRRSISTWLIIHLELSRLERTTLIWTLLSLILELFTNLLLDLVHNIIDFIFILFSMVIIRLLSSGSSRKNISASFLGRVFVTLEICGLGVWLLKGQRMGWTVELTYVKVRFFVREVFTGIVKVVVLAVGEAYVVPVVWCQVLSFSLAYFQYFLVFTKWVLGIGKGLTALSLGRPPCWVASFAIS